MGRLEGLVRRRREIKDIGNLATLERFRPTERAPSVLDIDFDKYKAKGITTLLLDVEGTLTEQFGWNIDKKIVDKIKSAGFTNIALVTNNTPEDEMSFVKQNWWIKQLQGAAETDVVLFKPDDPADRKPRPNMLLKALQYFDVKPTEALMVDDKSTAGIAAANAVGDILSDKVMSVQVDRLGKPDFRGDRFIRRPLENAIARRLARTQPEEASHNGERLETVVYQSHSATESFELPEWAKAISPELMAKSKIVNLGGPQVTLPTREIPEGEDPLADFIGHLEQVFDDYMWEHGRAIADGLTDTREILGDVEAELIRARMRRAARVTNGIGSVTDFEGLFARRHKTKPDKKNAARDQEVDKERDRKIEQALVEVGWLDPVHPQLRGLSNDAMNLIVRPYFADRGVDVRAGFFGKFAEAIVNIASNAAEGKKNPKWVQITATALKLGRVAWYTYDWSQQLKYIERDEREFANAKMELLAA